MKRALIAVLATVSIRAAVYYVSPTGVDSNSGLDLAHPVTLTNALNDANSGSPLVHAGDTVYMRGGVYPTARTGQVVLFSSRVNGTPASPVWFLPYGAEVPILQSTSAGSGVFYIYGSNTWFYGMEIRNTDTDRTIYRWPGVNIVGNTNGVINCYIHDVGVGVASFEATNSTIYGCAVYNCGSSYSGGNKLHDIYCHSYPPGNVLEENILFNGFGFGLSAYSELGEQLNSLHGENNVAFGNGVLITGAEVGYQANYLVGTCLPPTCVGGLDYSHAEMDNLTFVKNYGYFKYPYTNPGGKVLSVGTAMQTGYSITTNHTALIQSNYFGHGFFDIRVFTALTVLSNTWLTPPTYQHYDPNAAVQGVSAWDYNTFQSPFSSPIESNSVAYTWTQWKGGGFDAHSVLTTPAPTATNVFLSPNAYAGGRFKCVVYNWSLASTVNVDVTGQIKDGHRVSIIDAENPLAGPVATNTVSGTTLIVPMTGLTPATPVGVGWTPAHTAPEFGVFILNDLGAGSHISGARLSGARL